MLLQQTTNAFDLLQLTPWVVILPIAGLILNLIAGRRLGEKASGFIASLAAGLSFVVAALLAVYLSTQPGTYQVPFAQWISTGSFSVDWTFRVDTLSVTMMMVVAGVGTLIHIYAIGYMHQDVRHNGDPARFTRFFVYLNLFIAAMMVLVSADNFLMMFVGWEGVGLCSYLLIGFWYEKGQDGTGNAKAAKKAFVVNRIGDFGLLIAMFLIFWNFGSLQFDAVFEKAPEIAAAAPGVLLAITLFMLLGVTGKSAQLPLFVWLPDAMAGPTPVSALIHAATMVTAGVYLVARSHALYVLDPTAQAVVAWVGGLTAFFAATIAVGQNDIKKVLAYSTISQLGFMVAAVGMGAFVAGMFHLVTHAFFKALLFLSAGSVILGLETGAEAVHNASRRQAGKSHGAEVFAPGEQAQASAHTGEHAHTGAHSFDAQDMLNMGGLRTKMPTTFIVYLIGALALAGIFPLAGFFSKDEILAEALHLQPGIFVLLIAAAFLTAFYMGRQVLLVFFGKPRTPEAGRARENKSIITIPLIILAILSAIGGAFNLPGILTLEHWLEHTIEGLQPSVFNLILAGAALVVALLGIWLSYLVYGRQTLADRHAPDPLSKKLGGLFTALRNRWWVDEFYAATVVKAYHALAGFLTNPVDMGVIDALGNGLGSGTRSLSGVLRKVQTGLVRSYALVFMLGAVLILAYLVLR